MGFSHIGTQIRKRRNELNMSQDELAKLMGYKDRSTIAKIETGVHDVTQPNIVKFSEVLHTSIAYLMGWEEDDDEAIIKFPKAKPDMISKELIEIMNIFMNVSKDNQEYLLKTARMIYKEQNEK